MRLTKIGTYLFCLILLFAYHLPFAKSKGVPDPIQMESIIQLFSANIYHEFLSSHKILSSVENVEAEVVARISNRILQAVVKHDKNKVKSKELIGFQWEVTLISERKIDAWCLPGGKIAVYSSLFPLTQSDESMAVVLAHVIAHTLLRHGDPRMKNYLKSYLGGKDISAAYTEKPTETKDFFKMAYGNGDYVGVIKAFSEQDEMEADKLGSIFMLMAGYNPIESIVFWERMDRFKKTGRQPELLSSHPVYENRISRLKENIEETMSQTDIPIKKN